jgi:hypothetical protein
MKYGNCLVGAVILAARHGFRGKFVLKSYRKGWIPHILFRANDGSWYHYRLVRDVVPFPFHFLLFQGEFHTLKRHRRLDERPAKATLLHGPCA